MPEFERDMDVEKRTTLSELQMLLRNTPEIFGDQGDEIRQAVKDAKVEIQQKGSLSQATAERLDNLHRPFKDDFLKG